MSMREGKVLVLFLEKNKYHFAAGSIQEYVIFIIIHETSKVKEVFINTSSVNTLWNTSSYNNTVLYITNSIYN